MNEPCDDPHGWGASGLAELTGDPDGPPDFSRAGVLAEAHDWARRFRTHTGVTVDPVPLLAGRAGLLGLTRRGRVSAGGASRILATAEGHCALTLSRADDVDAVPALLESDDAPEDYWPAIERWARSRPATEVVDRLRLLGLPGAVVGEHRPRAASTTAIGPRAGRNEPVLVVDLTSMWAGPLCGRLLLGLGATVVKVESPSRPDGTRAGPVGFFDWVNAGKLSYAVEFDDRERLLALLSVADVVIEGSRPAALRTRGLAAEQVPPRPGRTWLRITGYGTEPAVADRVAFGDDAAAAGGLVGRGRRGPVFCGDAIADPLTGMEAALLVVQSLARGGGDVVDVSLADVAASYARTPPGPPDGGVALAPRAPAISGAASALGADNAAVDRLIIERMGVTC